MRDWKTFKPSSATPRSDDAPRLVRKRRSELTEPLETTDPHFEIALDMNAEQLTLMFDDPEKYESRPFSGTGHPPSDFQEQWRADAVRSKADPAESFGPWKNEFSVDGSTYYRKVTRLA